MINFENVHVRHATRQGGAYGDPIPTGELWHDLQEEIADQILNEKKEHGEAEVGGQLYSWYIDDRYMGGPRRKVVNVRIGYDDTDPNNAGWFVRWDEMDEDGEIPIGCKSLDAALNAVDPDNVQDALIEAANEAGVRIEDVTVMKTWKE
jgi:hypothetical protein